VKKDILTLLDLSKEDFDIFFERAAELKKRVKNGIFDRSLAGKTLGLIFEKPSTRTRISFEKPIFIEYRFCKTNRLNRYAR
jgi:ornithine carbamoyltransferase